MFAALGIILLIAGAILTFAVNEAVEGVDLAAIGWILMAGGGLSLIIAMIHAAGFWSMAGPRGTRVERHVSPDGNHVVEESHVR